MRTGKPQAMQIIGAEEKKPDRTIQNFKCQKAYNFNFHSRIALYETGGICFLFYSIVNKDYIFSIDF